MGASKEQRLKTATRRTEMIRLRHAGAEWDDIARVLKYANKGAAQKDYARVMDATAKEVREGAELERLTEIGRLNRLGRGLAPLAFTGEPKSASTMLRVIELRSRLGGWDTPPDVVEQAERDAIARVVPQMALVWAQVLDGLGLTADQRALVPGLMDNAIGSFLAQQHARRPALTAADEDEEDLEAA